MVLMWSTGISAHTVAVELETTPQPLLAGDIAPLCLPEETGDAEMTTPPKPSSSPDLGCLQDVPDIDADDGSLLVERKQGFSSFFLFFPPPFFF